MEVRPSKGGDELSGLYLSGGGGREQTCEIDKVFASELDRGKPLLYLPIAMDPAQISYEDCYQWIHSVFGPFGITDITMWLDLRGKSLEELKEFSAVYIGGGNTFNLMHSILQDGFHAPLTAFKEEGGLIYGGSAGAIVMGSNISTCEHMDENTVLLRASKALSYLDDYSIWCHYEEENDHLINRFIDTYGKPVIALSEETGLQVKNGRTKVLGTIPAYVFASSKKKETIEPGGDFSQCFKSS